MCLARDTLGKRYKYTCMFSKYYGRGHREFHGRCILLLIVLIDYLCRKIPHAAKLHRVIP